MRLVSLEDAKLHLHITDPARDAEVALELDHASALIFEYIGARADASWDETSAPDTVKAGTLRLLGHLYEHRGDDAALDTDNKIWEALSLLLMRARDPAVA